jgi:hypothetical protein
MIQLYPNNIINDIIIDSDKINKIQEKYNIKLDELENHLVELYDYEQEDLYQEQWYKDRQRELEEYGEDLFYESQEQEEYEDYCPCCGRKY